MPIFHPAAALRSTSVLKETHITFAKLKVAIKKYPEFIKDRDAARGEQQGEQNVTEVQKTLP